MQASILQILAMLAVQYPELREDFSRIVAGRSVPDEKWQATLTKLERTSASYFPTHSEPSTPGDPVPAQPSIYERYLETEPDDSQLQNGDWLMTLTFGDGTPRWWARPAGSNDLLPPGSELVRIVKK